MSYTLPIETDALPSVSGPTSCDNEPCFTCHSAPICDFQLDDSIFNQSLYSRLISFWFSGLDETATSASTRAMRRWFKHGASEAQVAEFDYECQERFGAVIEAIGPESLSLPDFRSYAIEKAQAGSIASPFLAEVRKARLHSTKRAVSTLLALIILLDQIPRNLYRTPSGLRRVYTHYDRLAFALLYASLASPATCPIAREAFRLRPVYRSWMFVPLLHAEDLASQHFLHKIFRQCKTDLAKVGDVAGERFAENRLSATQRHLKIVDKFGRFPHRNEGLGRQDTPEERRWLESGGETFGVKQVRICARL